MADVAAALANWNGLQHIGRCLESLHKQTNPPNEIVVVDNGSTDGSKEWIRQHYPAVRLLENSHNTGYAAGYNQAIRATSTPFVLILNTDAFLAVDFIENATRAISAHSDAAAVTGRTFQEATNELISGGFFLRRQVRIVPGELSDETVEVFGVTGSVALFRRDALEALAVENQYYDEAYFCYGEDIDLAWRAQLQGWKMLSLPVAAAHHVGSGSLDGRLRFVEKPQLYQRHTLKNRYLTVIRNASPGILLELLPGLMLTELLLWPFLLLRQPWRVPYLLLSFADVLRLFPSTLRKRRQVQARRRVSAAHIRRYFRGF